MMSFESPTSPSVSSPTSSPARTRRCARGGFTLLEVMIATAVTLLMMISLAQIFKIIGDSMQQGRSVLELNNRLRSVVYRLRADLDNLTVIPAPPANPSTGSGYLQVYDGSTTDFTTSTQISMAASRFGDVDDILMATVRAGDVWFTGKVPLYVLEKRAPDRNTAADFAMIPIASQHAEVAVFLQPLVTGDGNPNRSPEFFLNSALGAVAFEDTDPFPNFPDSFRLHYRMLLIRPDLNLVSDTTIADLSSVAPAGSLPGGIMDNSISSTGTNEYWTVSNPDPGLPTPLCDMAAPHQQCDLSIRRVFGTGTGSTDFVAANSLEDLVDPANRFAHVQVPIPGTVSTTMPVLALGTALLVNGGDPLGTLLNSPVSATTPFQVGSGFLHPAFVLLNNRAGEDLLASDVLAFDIKLFDPDAPLLGTTGGDGVYGTAADDDGDGSLNDLKELGWAGSDDLILSPNDPGYALALSAGSPVVGTGEYVDLAWAKKLAAHGGSISPATNVWSPLSGFALANFNANGLAGAYTDSLFKSGSVLMAGTNLQLFQASYDTYTSGYEGDGLLQAQLTSRVGVCRVNGAVDLYGVGGSDYPNLVADWRSSPAPTFDAGSDGIDNAGSFTGVDDPSELETSPPFPIPLRGLKISVRMEDPRTRQIKQMSAAKEFVSQ